MEIKSHLSSSKKIPVIYILSNGRSGSTLLDMLLGQYPQVWTMGEAQILPWELKENRLPCGCGKAIRECEFWKPIIPFIPVENSDYPIHYFRESHTGGKAIRMKYLWDILKRKPSGNFISAVSEYGRNNAEYFSVVQQRAGEYTDQNIQWLVDASKDVYRLFWMLHSDFFDVRVIHLVKDPRGFVFSILRHQKQLSAKKSIRFAGRWLFENRFFSYLSESSILDGKVFFLRYEDLASKPDQIIASIMTWLNNMEYTKPGFREYTNHAIAGNPMRWKNNQIKLDQKWHQLLPKLYAQITWLICGGLAKTYGYHQDRSLD